MRGSMASLPQLGLRPRASRLRDASASGHPLLASARMNRQPRIRRRISKRFGGCGSNPSQQQRPRDDRNAVSGSWLRRRDLRLWRRAPVNSPPGCSVCAELICQQAIRAQTVCSRKRLHPQIPVKIDTTEKGAAKRQPFSVAQRQGFEPW